MKKSALGLAAALACGCGGEAKLSELQAEIFTPTCATAGCHTGTAAANGLDLSAGKSHASLVGVDAVGAPGEKRVVAGDSSASVLVKVLEGQYQNITPMPSGLPRLPQADRDAIRAWIDAGAKND